MTNDDPEQAPTDPPTTPSHDTEAIGPVWFRRDQLPVFSPFPGLAMRSVSGTNVMAIWVNFDPKFEVPVHHHPHEQMGLVLEGHLTLTIGEEMSVLGPGDAYAIPPDVRHGATTAEDGCALIDIFSPPRDDYR